MTQPLRSQAKDALLTLITGVVFPQSVNGHTTWVNPPARRLKLFNNVDPSVQPAAFIVQHRELYGARREGLPPKRELEVGIWCYASTADATVIGDELLDSMEEGIEAVMVPDTPQRNELTFHGLVHSVRIDRSSALFIRDPGDIDGQALLVLPVKIMLP